MQNVKVNSKYVCLALLFMQIREITGLKRTVCDNEELVLSCEGTQLLVIEKAMYGRTQSEPTCGSQEIQVLQPCSLPSALSTLTRQCFGRQSCTIKVNSNTFADPCPNVPKYLEIEYFCVNNDVIFSMCAASSIDKPAGYVMSPNYPDSYSASTNCVTEIIPQPDRMTGTTILDIEIEARDSKGCFDTLVLKEHEKSYIKHNYCGNIITIQPPTQVLFHHLVVQLKTDGMNHYRGFLLKFNSTKSSLAEGKILTKEEKRKELENAPVGIKGRAQRLSEQEKDPDMWDDGEVVEERDMGFKPPDFNMGFKPPDFNKLAPEPQQAKDSVDPSNQDNVIASKPAVTTVGCNEEGAKQLLPPNAEIKKLIPGKVVHIACLRYYTMMDEEEGILVCHQDTWVGFPGTCLMSGCGILDDIEHGHVTIVNTPVGSQAEYTCDPGYQLLGEIYRVCLPNQKWSGARPLCLGSDIPKRRGRSPYNVGIEIPMAVACTLIYLMIKKRLSQSEKICPSKMV